MLLSDFPVLFNADFIFKEFSRKPSKFKYFSSLCNPGKEESLKCSLAYHDPGHCT